MLQNTMVIRMREDCGPYAVTVRNGRVYNALIETPRRGATAYRYRQYGNGVFPTLFDSECACGEAGL